MKTLLAATALTALMAFPAVAANDHSQGKTQVTKQMAKHAKHLRSAKSARASERAPSRFVHRPEYDAHVNGQYVGSDPDPRIRATLRREWSEDAADRLHR
jgi:hypothetical protein